jgi:hypothetical protein
VLWVYGNNVVAKVLSDNLRDYPAGTLVSLEKDFIKTIEASGDQLKLPMFVRFRDEKTNQDYVIHTKWPRFIGLVTYSYRVQINKFLMLEPAGLPEDEFQKILNNAADWVNYSD